MRPGRAGTRRRRRRRGPSAEKPSRRARAAASVSLPASEPAPVAARPRPRRADAGAPRPRRRAFRPAIRRGAGRSPRAALVARALRRAPAGRTRRRRRLRSRCTSRRRRGTRPGPRRYLAASAASRPSCRAWRRYALCISRASTRRQLFAASRRLAAATRGGAPSSRRFAPCVLGLRAAPRLTGPQKRRLAIDPETLVPTDRSSRSRATSSRSRTRSRGRSAAAPPPFVALDACGQWLVTADDAGPPSRVKIRRHRRRPTTRATSGRTRGRDSSGLRARRAIPTPRASAWIAATKSTRQMSTKARRRCTQRLGTATSILRACF
mmetsp:Transcript_14846/g.46072  ORF Transcript_14846/g.46072 Transcript_14846/m.46072 type:complete len:323 (+) Transcript_14846:315-1283(+)